MQGSTVSKRPGDLLQTENVVE